MHLSKFSIFVGGLNAIFAEAPVKNFLFNYSSELLTYDLKIFGILYGFQVYVF